MGFFGFEFVGFGFVLEKELLVTFDVACFLFGKERTIFIVSEPKTLSSPVRDF